MVNVFLSCSSKDHNIIKSIIDDLKLVSDNYRLIYFLQPYKKNTSMEEIFKYLREAELFIIFITNNSLDSEYVQSELKEAITLTNLKKIKEIYPIILDSNINAGLDTRVPDFLKRGKINYCVSVNDAIQCAKKFILKY